MKNYLVVLLFIPFLFCTKLNWGQTQNPFQYTCEIPHNISNYLFPTTTFGGYMKPERTDYPGVPSDAYFPVLIVFVQFANDPGPDVDWWHKGEAPNFMNAIIASNKKHPSGDNWWDTYSEQNESLSDFWMEQSRGHFHVIGKSYSIILDHEYTYYQTNGGINKINDEIYLKLNALNSINWRDFDKWKLVHEGPNIYFKYEPDGYVDMIYKIHRSHAPFLNMPAGGICFLYPSYSQGDNYLIDSTNHIFINGEPCEWGSGLTITPGHTGTEGQNDYSTYQPLDKISIVSFSSHEHGHYLFGFNHVNYGKMSGSDAPYGLDECLSPWESIKMGYMKPKVVNFNETEYKINDFSSRNNDSLGQVLQVPINGDNEFFLISSRRKISTYDRIMWGDTAHGDPNRIINPDYGKGVYIYHNQGGYNFPPDMDQECADGLYSWQFAGYRYPDWSNTQFVEYYVKTGVSYNNDQSKGLLDCADGKSVFTWFSLGGKNPCLNCDGTDKIFTNKKDVWTSREFQGDRWDAWNVGYNEVFSPYSSPSTKNWTNSNTGIFIWYKNYDTLLSQAIFKIYRTGEGGLSEGDILNLTPPSKPTGLTVSLTDCTNNVKFPMLSWNHNMEPDMISNHNTRRYKIYRADSPDHLLVPYNYLNVQVVDIDANSPAVFIDTEMTISCVGSNPFGGLAELRYMISAVDTSGWESVRSDFAAQNLTNDPIGVNSNGNNIPKIYKLSQNYPNPFNPTTVIEYDIPKDSFVKLVVYNVLGKEVVTLVNEQRRAGTYKVQFDARNFSSGIYFYKLISTEFSSVKKMVLVK